MAKRELLAGGGMSSSNPLFVGMEEGSFPSFVSVFGHKSGPIN